MMDRMRHPPIPFPECISMVAFLFLLAPTIVLIAVLIMQRFQPRRDLDPETLRQRVVEGGRIEPRFRAVNDSDGHQPDPEMLMDRHSIPTG